MIFMDCLTVLFTAVFFKFLLKNHILLQKKNKLFVKLYFSFCTPNNMPHNHYTQTSQNYIPSGKDSLNVPLSLTKLWESHSWLQALILPFWRAFTLENLELYIFSLHFKTQIFYNLWMCFSRSWEPSSLWNIIMKRVSTPNSLSADMQELSSDQHLLTNADDLFTSTNLPLLFSNTFPKVYPSV